VKTIFPDGHRTTDLTRPEDGDQKIIFHCIPFTECVRRQLSRRAFAGHQYLEYEPQKCPRNPGARGFCRVNSGTWFEAAQLRANQLSAAVGGRGPNVLWQGWSGSAMPHLAGRTRLGTAYTVRRKPTIAQNVPAESM
jgi:hypothetical protein